MPRKHRSSVVVIIADYTFLMSTALNYMLAPIHLYFETTLTECKSVICNIRTHTHTQIYT